MSKGTIRRYNWLGGLISEASYAVLCMLIGAAACLLAAAALK